MIDWQTAETGSARQTGQQIVAEAKAKFWPRGVRAGWLVMALFMAGCGATSEGLTSGAQPDDPYADLPGGGARYTGNLGDGGMSGTLAGIATVDGFAASAGDVIHFGDGQVALDDAARRIASAQARWLGQNKGFTARIEGHADEQGTREYNLALGARRAAAVQEYLIAKGVEAGRLSTVSYGKERPVSNCGSDEDCAARNRRVRTAVAPGSGA